MGKIRKEDCQTISIYEFRKWNQLNGFDSGIITWTNFFGKEKNSINYAVRIESNMRNSRLELNYTITDTRTDERLKIEQQHPIISLPCHYGGRRYFFKCSFRENGVYCGRMVAKLYLSAGSRYFRCRYCYGLTYDSRISGLSYCIPEIEKYQKGIKRWYYRGKATRKHLLYLKKERSLRNSIVRFSGQAGGH